MRKVELERLERALDRFDALVTDEENRSHQTRLSVAVKEDRRAVEILRRAIRPAPTPRRRK